MKRDTLSDAIVIFCGVLIGYFASRALAIHIGTWIVAVGWLFGGACAWCAVQPKKMLEAVVRTADWRPYGLFWKALGAAVLASVSAASTVLFVIAVFAMTTAGAAPDIKTITVSLSMLSAVAALVLFVPVLDNGKNEFVLRRCLEIDLKIASHWNPASAFVRLVLFLINAVVTVPVWIPIAGSNVYWFSRRVFIAVHCERRRIAFFAATLFSGVAYGLCSYHAWDPTYAVYAALMGALAGLLSREFIAKRWLKVIPA